MRTYSYCTEMQLNHSTVWCNRSLRIFSLVIVNGKPIYGDAKLMVKFNVTTEPVSFCGETKNLNLDVFPNGKLTDVQQRLVQEMKVYNLKLAKVDPCAQ